MFTKNFDKIILSAISQKNINSINVLGNSTSIRSNANSLQIGYSSYSVYHPAMNRVNTSYNSYGGVIFGTGTTSPTRDDYCLSGDIITTISTSSIGGFTKDDDGLTGEYTYTVTNTGSSDITIGEIGLITSTYSNTSYTAAEYKFLVERTVLETPITIPAGGVGQITYTIRMNFPTV